MNKLNLILICVNFNIFAQKTPEQIYERYYTELGGKVNT